MELCDTLRLSIFFSHLVFLMKAFMYHDNSPSRIAGTKVVLVMVLCDFQGFHPQAFQSNFHTLFHIFFLFFFESFICFTHWAIFLHISRFMFILSSNCQPHRTVFKVSNSNSWTIIAFRITILSMFGRKF